jgi:hypothetical protein
VIKEEAPDVDLGSRTLCGSHITCFDPSDRLWVEILGSCFLGGNKCWGGVAATLASCSGGFRFKPSLGNRISLPRIYLTVSL